MVCDDFKLTLDDFAFTFDGAGDDDVNLGGCDVYVVGEHLDGATAVEYCETADGEAFYTMDAAYDPETGRLSGHADFVGSSPQRGFARVTTPGGPPPTPSSSATTDRDRGLTPINPSLR